MANTRLFTCASELRSLSGRRMGFSDAFSCYDRPYEYLESLRNIEGLEEVDYYKYYIRIEYQILNKHGYQVSGGERSEFNLLQEISDALKYDMLLIDEPESSFDNLFLKNEVNELIKSISRTIPVIVVTHNNTVGASIKPDYVVYTKKKVTQAGVSYHIYAGYPTDKELASSNGERISNHDIILDCLEAGQTAYRERGTSYEMLED